MIIATVGAAIVFPIVGYVCDRISPTKFAPFAFIARFICCCFFYTLTSPNSIYAYIICALIVISTVIEQISMDSIFAKNLPKETRGVLNGFYSFLGQLGILIFSFIAGWSFDAIGPKSPFALIGIIDILFALLCFY